ncbi:MAG: hypothetical protein BWK73_38725 [Thiothrix lacustris]|uniref:Uncharacterized protein n=1 Tax=Thiothrix lacustris TaxID=525917 RepID=A0A1Y1QE80_9GAMM|nr:MAG: hypothetical protein BWK73_38725 [Thiothrix lacustris]
MFQAVEAEIDQDGKVKLKEPIRLKDKHKALVIILDQSEGIAELALLSEAALAKDWNRAEEEEAWQAFQ